MKLYILRPQGHGELTFITMASSQEEALEIIKNKISESQYKYDGSIYHKYDKAYLELIESDYYQFEVYEQGQVAINDND